MPNFFGFFSTWGKLSKLKEGGFMTKELDGKGVLTGIDTFAIGVALVILLVLALAAITNGLVRVVTIAGISPTEVFLNPASLIVIFVLVLCSTSLVINITFRNYHVALLLAMVILSLIVILGLIAYTIELHHLLNTLFKYIS